MPDQNLPTRGSSFYAPFFQNFQHELAQMVDRFHRSTPAQVSEDYLQNCGLLIPAINVAETETGLEISADIP